jgi:hypothetical protein
MLPYFKLENIVQFHHVKNVTLTKKMYCTSFKLSVEDAMLSEEEELKAIQKYILFSNSKVKKNFNN